MPSPSGFALQREVDAVQAEGPVQVAQVVVAEVGQTKPSGRRLGRPSVAAIAGWGLAAVLLGAAVWAQQDSARAVHAATPATSR